MTEPGLRQAKPRRSKAKKTNELAAPKAEEDSGHLGVAEASQAAQMPEVPALDLGVLNRHWYRRCLDWLDDRLRKSASNPSIAQTKELCDHIITDFLTAVTGQAPDSGQLQFPADRAYYIPFEGDWAERFNFAKPFYRFSGRATNEQRSWLYEDSLWSFFPWAERFGDVRIDSARSVSVAGKTIPFEEMISVRAQFTKSEAAGQKRADTGTAQFLMQKSLILRGSDRNYIKRIANSEGALDAILEGCQLSLFAVFQIYQLTPGNAAVESILLRHVSVIRWLTSVIARGGEGGELLTEQDEGFREVFRAFLRYFFLDIPFRESFPREALRVELQDELKALASVVEEFEAEATAERGPSVETEVEPDLEADSRWQVLTRIARKSRTPFGMWLSENEESRRDQGELLTEIKTDLVSFRAFLKVESERRVEEDLAAALGAALPKAGESRQSLVWAVPDFETVDRSLPEGRKVQAKSRDKVQALSSMLTLAYQAFFHQFDAVCLQADPRPEKIKAYWRTFGQANRREKVFSSFEHRSASLYKPPMVIAKASRGAVEVPLEWQHLQARSQNFFLRLKICDSVNEPIINGMFIFSTDHDEVKFKGKPENVVSRDDLEDLLSFAKVYFFTFRDYLRALDQAQSARDIGQLNQYLYDKRLGNLEQRMQHRVETNDFRKGGIVEKGNWARFTYEVLNNYGLSLLTKPEEVQSETFPYDRLLIVPLNSELPFASEGDARSGSSYDLPFYLFQSLFVERLFDEVQGGHYSLIKPFQSPVDELKTSETERFRVKSFQQVSQKEGREVRLDRYLEKLYVGAQESQESQPSREAREHVQEAKLGGPLVVETAGSREVISEPESYVVKLVGRDELPDTPSDRGRDWAGQAVDTFWSRYSPVSESHSGLWRQFLRLLTSFLQRLRHRNSARKEPSDEHWFLLRFALLRVLLSRRDDNDEALCELRRLYKLDLKLRFDEDESLDLLTLARSSSDDPFNELAPELSLLSEKIKGESSQSEHKSIPFVQFLLRHEDPFVLMFFQHLTDLMLQKGEMKSGNATWYQPLLRRPVEVATGKDMEKSSDFASHKNASLRIQERIPPYDEIRSGKHALSMFLGLVNVSVGEGKQRSLLRCLVAMIRDYDDTQTGAGLTPEEVRQQLEVDLRDLGLYTSTFFHNVQKFVVDAMRGEANRILLTDVSQIARNWYSTGMDWISLELGRSLDLMLGDRTDVRLGSLRPELVDTFFDSILEVMLRVEERPDAESEEIRLESFPFDRVLHIPLLLGASEGERLCYARTQIVDPAGLKSYEEIRSKGRTWPKRGGRKVPVLPIRHFGLSLSNKAGSHGPEQVLLDSDPLKQLLGRVIQPQALDALMRSLYEAEPIQTLAVAGLIRHLAKLALPAEQVRDMELRLQTAIQDSVRIVERRDVSAGLGRSLTDRDIFSDVYMDSEALLHELSKEQDTELRRNLTDIKVLPGWYELFAAAEASGDFTYGLRSPQGETVSSKLFYVYYSFKAPRDFTEVPRLDARFRGIFALIVDDASTDIKDKEGEDADQQDIRTFIHNCVRSLRLFLEIQTRENKIRQPGVESFILGMLHRLKNDLGKPVVALDLLKGLAKSQEQVGQIDGAKATIMGLKDLFENLRELSEMQHGFVPMRPYSTNWLGWIFLAKVCMAAKKVADELGRETDGVTAEQHELERIHRRAEAELREKPGDPLRSIDIIQREVKELESVLAELAAHSSGGEIKPEVVLAFHVFSDAPLEFRGSFQLEEAFNVLFENAFQAFWSYLGSTTGQAGPRLGVLKVVVRMSEEVRNEVVIEIGNSSQPIDQAVENLLNDPTPQPMTRKQHSTKVRKRGGSGFGHYYARRIVGDLCGGRKARRKLDVRIKYEKAASLAKVDVNLLAAGEGVQVVSVDDLEAEVARNFIKDRQAGGIGSIAQESTSGAGERFRFPAKFDVEDLFEVVQLLLAAKREALENKFLSWWQSDVCSTLGRRCEEVRHALFENFKKPSLDATRAQIESESLASVRRDSFNDLQRFVHRVRDRDRSLLGQVAQGNKLLQRTLARPLAGRDLEAEHLLKVADVGEIRKEFEQEYTQFLRSSNSDFDLMNTLLSHLGEDEYGMPAPSRDRLTDLLAEARWDVRGQIENDKLHLAVSLVDGDPTAIVVDLNRDGPDQVEEMAAVTNNRFIGPAFHALAHSFERKNGEDPVGSLWLEEWTPGNKKPHPVPRMASRRTVHLVLYKQK